MSFDQFLNQAWDDHAKQPDQVALRFQEGLKLIDNAEQIPQMAHLVTHVMGEHLGKWQKGIETLQKLKALPNFQSGGEAGESVARSIMSLEVASGIEMAGSDLSISNQVRALAIAASAVSEQENLQRAESLFKKAVAMADGLEKSDPAYRTLAATAHNIACGLEETPDKTSQQMGLMIFAAQSSRKFWEVAGTWLQVGRSEYRLAQSYLNAKKLDQALVHAQLAIQIAQANQAPALELFSGFEALALVQKASGNIGGFQSAKLEVEKYFKQLSPDDQGWCLKSLQALQAT